MSSPPHDEIEWDQKRSDVVTQPSLIYQGTVPYQHKPTDTVPYQH
jgi:hypothetical protein